MTGTDDPAGLASERRFAPNFLLELFNNPLDPGYADAAQARAGHGPRRPWRRRGALGLRTVALALTGFLLAVAYHQAVAAAPAQSTVHAGLVNQVKAAQARTDTLQARTDTLRQQVNVQQKIVLGGDSAELVRIRALEAATGLAAVTGPGAVVRLTDAPAPVDPTTGKTSDQNISRVLDVDMQAVVNGLWATGAEAIAVNGQRLTSTSTIRTAGTTILVDFRPVASPYDVSAVGPPSLPDVFGRSPAAASMSALVRQYGLGFTIQPASSLQLPAASGPPLRYAHLPSPAPSGGTK